MGFGMRAPSVALLASDAPREILMKLNRFGVFVTSAPPAGTYTRLALAEHQMAQILAGGTPEETNSTQLPTGILPYTPTGATPASLLKSLLVKEPPVGPVTRPPQCLVSTRGCTVPPGAAGPRLYLKESGRLYEGRICAIGRSKDYLFRVEGRLVWVNKRKLFLECDGCGGP